MTSEKHRGSAISTTISSDMEPGRDKATELRPARQDETSTGTSQSIEPPSATSRMRSGWWYFEVVCMVLALALFGFYYWVLKTWDNRPVREWFESRPSFIFKYVVGNLGSAVSSIISSLKVLMFIPITASMGQLKWHYFFQRQFSRPVADLQTFDAASRGVSGSIKLIVSDKRFYSLHITLGCVLFLATLYLGSATQNTISYAIQEYWPVDYNVNDNGTAILPVTEIFDVTPRYDVLGVDSQNLFEDPSMEAAIFTAWSYYESTQTDYLTYDRIPSNCSSEFCRWNQTTSLAIRRECHSVPGVYADGVGRSDQANISSMVDAANNGSSTVMPTILHLKATPAMPDNSSFMTTYNKNRGLILHLAAIAEHNDQRIDAAECILFWAAEHNSKTVYNVFSEINLNETFEAVYDLPENRTSTEDDKDIVFKAPCNNNNGTGTCQFTVTKTAHLGLRKLLSEFLTGAVYRVPSQDGRIFKASSPRINMFAWSWRESSSNFSDPCPLNSTLDAYLENTAQGLSGYIRAVKSTPLNGDNGYYRGVYVIMWRYVIYLGVMLILSLYLFVFTMYSTRDMPAWKTSLLPFLYHGFDRPVSDVGNELSYLPWMEEISKEKRVTLRDDGDGLGLRLRAADRELAN